MSSMKSVAIGGVLMAAAALSGCAGYSNTYAYGSGGYEDYAYNGGPYYYGDVNVDGYWYSGPIRYRDYAGRREFYVHGTWRRGVTRNDEDRFRNRLPDRDFDR